MTGRAGGEGGRCFEVEEKVERKHLRARRVRRRRRRDVTIRGKVAEGGGCSRNTSDMAMNDRQAVWSRRRRVLRRLLARVLRVYRFL